MTETDARRQLEFFKAEVRMEGLSIGDKALVQSNLMIVQALIELKETCVMILEGVLDVRDATVRNDE